MTKTRNLISLVAITLALTAPVAAQKKAKIPSDPEVATKLKALKSIAGDKKFTQDAKGIEIIDELIQKQEKGLNAQDQKNVAKGLDSLLNKGRLRPATKAQIYNATAEALGRRHIIPRT